MLSDARLTAFRVLLRVDDGGYASDLLLRYSKNLDSRDAGLASEIVFGSLRRQGQLDYLIDKQTGGRALDREVRIALRMGVYQLRQLDRVPSHAAVGESVELVKRARKESAAGLVNAVLRRIRRTDAIEWPTRAVRLSMPEWLLIRWDLEFGAGIADRIAEEFLRRPDTWVRNPETSADIQAEASAEVPGAFRVISGDVTGLRIQDIGSQSIVPLLDVRPGMTFLDLCAAPGNKTAQALETEGVTGIACDLYEHRLKTVAAPVAGRVVLDAARPLPFRAKFDRVLIDAPCTGTGTLGRNPEIRWRLQPSDIDDLQGRQLSILRQGLQLLAPEGKLVYSTCSLEREENEAVLDGVRDLAQVESTHRRTPGLDPGDGFFAAVLTSLR